LRDDGERRLVRCEVILTSLELLRNDAEDSLGNSGDFLIGGRGDWVEHHAAAAIAGVDAVEEDRVEVNVEPEGRIEPLNHGHGAGLERARRFRSGGRAGATTPNTARTNKRNTMPVSAGSKAIL
jgi:hypothetical protein